MLGDVVHILLDPDASRAEVDQGGMRTVSYTVRGAGSPPAA